MYFVCVICAICGRLWGFYWVLLRVYFPADSAEDAEECSKLYYLAEKFVWIIGVNEDYLVIVWVLLRVILPQITQITQRNTASCIITQRKTDCLRLMLFCCFGVCLRLSARSAGDIGVSFVLIDWVLLRWYSPADIADDAEEYSWAVLFRRERQFVVCLRLSAWSA